MEIMYRYLSLFLSLVLLTLPSEAGPGIISEYGNFTGEPGWNATQNASDYYFNSSSNWSCFTAGEIKEYAGEIPADGIAGEITFLTDSPMSELFPVWTADGNYIMYTVQRDKSGSSESYIMKANGSEIERTGIGEGNLTGFSDVNLNGTEMILTKSTDSQPGLYLVNLENRTVILVTDDPEKSEGWGAWCRLGKKIVYTQESAGSPSQLWIVNRDGSNKTRLGTSENIGVGKDWCPLGLKILYSAKNSKEKDDLWLIDWYGTNQTQLTDTPYGEWNPSFSPDGKRIVYISDEGGKPEIWLWDLEGNYKIRLTNNIGIIDSNPRWNPDGSKIVFTAQNLQNISNNSTIKSSGPDLLDNSGNSLLTNNSVIVNNSVAGDNSIIVNNSVTNGSDSTLGNSSNNSIFSGSELAVLELGSARSVSPLPTITSVEVDPIRETLGGEAFNVSITVRNEG
jgi:TolB protein